MEVNSPERVQLVLLAQLNSLGDKNSEAPRPRAAGGLFNVELRHYVP
jgi:hypothetical protein